MSWRDEVIIHRLMADRDVRRFLGGPVPVKERRVRFRMYLNGSRQVGVWIVALESSRIGLGMVILAPHHDGGGHEVSYMFEKIHWGQGFATEAVCRVVEHAIRDVGLPHVIAETQRVNFASICLLRRLQMTEVKWVERFGTEQIVFSTT